MHSHFPTKKLGNAREHVDKAGKFSPVMWSGTFVHVNML